MIFLDLLDEFEVGDEVTFDELREMGWRGTSRLFCNNY